MAFNIWERWPWTSFQNLNLDWLMKAVKEAVTKAEEASASVGQFDARITTNTEAIEQLSDDMETISSPVRVYVNSDREAFYRGQHITGVELKAMLRTHGDLPYVEFNGEVYMLDSVSNAGDLRFSMGHTSGSMDDDLVIRHIMIPAQSYSCAYSISNIGSGGGSSNVFTVTITYRGDDATPEYTCDHTFAEITSQLSAGRTPVFVFKYGFGYEVSAVYDVSDTRINIYDSPSISSTNGSVNISRYTIYSDNTIGINAAVTQLAALDNIIQFVNDGVTTNALLKTAQTLSAAEQAQVKQNLGISGGAATGAVLYDTQQSLTDVQKAQARDNIGSVTAMTNIPVTLRDGVHSTTMTSAEILNHLVTNGCYIEWNGLYFHPAGGTYSGPYGTLYFECVWPASSQKAAVSVFQFNMNGGDSAPTIERYARDININGSQPYIQVANATTYNLPSNTLVEFTGDSTSLSISLATATETDITHEYHFIFYSGSTPTTLTLPNTVRQPDGFTVEANHVYEVSILNNNMTAQGWAVTA